MGEMLNYIIVSLISCVGTLGGVIAVLYFKKESLQDSKDNAIKEERARLDAKDEMLRLERNRADNLLRDQRDRLTQDKADAIFFLVSHYERLLRANGLNRKDLEIQAKNTERFVISDVASITQEIQKKIDEESSSRIRTQEILERYKKEKGEPVDD